MAVFVGRIVANPLLSEAEVLPMPGQLFPMARRDQPEVRGFGSEKRVSGRLEIAAFSEAVQGAEVRLCFVSYRKWLASFTGEAGAHAARVLERALRPDRLMRATSGRILRCASPAN